MIGHNNPPRDRTFKRRWAAAIFDCTDPEKPAGAVAMAFRLYHDMDLEGRGSAISNLAIAQSCGTSERSVRTFKGWLLKAGFVRVLARGGRGGDSQYQACIPETVKPAKSAAKKKEQPATITGNSEFNWQPLPAIENELPEIPAAETKQPADFAAKRKTSPAPARVVDLNNIYNNTNQLENNTPPLSEQVAARESGNLPVVGPAEEHVGHGVIVNCETVRHRDFVISLKSIEMQLCGAQPMDKIKAAAVGHALQWALEIESGKDPRKVVPDKPANFIRGSLQAQQRHDSVAAVRRDAAKPKSSKPSRWG